MKRFMAFPLVFGACGALVLPISLFEGLAGTSPVAMGRVTAGGTGFWLNLTSQPYTPWIPFAGEVIGVVVGLILAIWDLFRNKGDESAVKRLPLNLLYCGFYAFCLCVANASLGLLILSGLTNGSPIISIVVALQFLGAFSFNLTAILWAAIRSILTDDILTPRVLRDKLRERARLE